MSDWQPIDTAPKDGSWVLLWLPSPRSYLVKARWLDSEEYVDDIWHEWQQQGGDRVRCILPGPTHWMPLPKPPK